MSNQLFEHIKKFTKVSEEEFASILQFFEPLSVKKKTCLLQETQLCRKNFFVVKGCLRMYFMKDTGIEQTTQFALENWWITDGLSFMQQKPSSFYIQAVENSEVLALSFEAQEKMFAEFPQMERYFRMVHQKAFAASQLRIKYLYDYSREELYFNFANSYPAFIQRIPQYLLASFLGFTPEYLSEIKKKHLGK